MPFKEFKSDDVLQVMGLKPKDEGVKDLYLDCPICNETRGRLGVNIETGISHCFNCGFSGNLISLYANVNGVDNSTAYKRLAHVIYGDPISTEVLGNERAFTGKVETKARKKIPLAEKRTLREIDSFNRAFLDSLTLSKRHVEDLTKRGLTSEQISKIGFKSFPEKGALTVPAALIAQGHDPIGIPGFYKRGNSAAMLMAGKGYLIPIYSHLDDDGKKVSTPLLTGFQIRLDDSYRDSVMAETGRKMGKYLTFSTGNKPYGAAMAKNLLIAGYAGTPQTRVCVTEGCLKAYIANALSGRQTISILGVNNMSELKKTLLQLKKEGCVDVFECLDMDKKTNKDVGEAQKKIEEIVSQVGMIYHESIWDPKFKGMDDFLLNRKK